MLAYSHPDRECRGGHGGAAHLEHVHPITQPRKLDGKILAPKITPIAKPFVNDLFTDPRYSPTAAQKYNRTTPTHLGETRTRVHRPRLHWQRQRLRAASL